MGSGLEAPSSKIKSHTGKKEESGSVAMQTISVDYINENYKGNLHVFTDGSKDIDKHMAEVAFVVATIMGTPPNGIYSDRAYHLSNLTIMYSSNRLYDKKVQVGKDQEKAQSEKTPTPKNRGGKKLN